MKKNVYLFLLLSFIVSCTSKPHYTVKGKIEGSDSITFYLMKRDAGRTIKIDSAVSRKGSFTMKGGAIEYPQLIQLIAGNSRKRTAFYLENSDITVAGNLDSLYNAKVTGSKTQDEYNAFIESSKPLSNEYSRTYQEYQVARKTADASQLQRLEKQADSIQKEMLELQKNFVTHNPSSYVTPAILSSLASDLAPEELESMINGLDTAVAAVPQIKSLKANLVVMKTVSVGQKAPDFTMNDTSGTPVSLSSKLGPKLLLIDFWAAWCNPCRQENPNVVKVYNQFHKKGFDVLGVSLDQRKEDWLRAIAADKLTWTHVSDLQYWGNEAAKLYAVGSIPSNFLLDGNGIIIGRNLRGDDLYKKVKEVMEK